MRQSAANRERERDRERETERDESVCVRENENDRVSNEDADKDSNLTAAFVSLQKVARTITFFQKRNFQIFHFVSVEAISFIFLWP